LIVRDADGRRSLLRFKEQLGGMVAAVTIAVTTQQLTFRFTTLIFPQEARLLKVQ
jgi:hypothetical protein